ncbi:MAG: hypothetical protein AB8F94_28775 [Saprospiraceae bacterium]
MKKAGALLFVIVLFFGCQKSQDAEFEKEKNEVKQGYGIEILLQKERTYFDVFETLEGTENKSHLPLTKFFHFIDEKISRENRNIRMSLETFARLKYDIKKEGSFESIDSVKVFSIIQILKLKTNNKAFSNEEQFSEIVNTLEELPNYFSQAKRIIQNPSKEKLEKAIQDYSQDYFYLKNELPLLLRKPDILKEDQIDFSQKNEKAQLAVKDFIAFLNSQLFELNE